MNHRLPALHSRSQSIILLIVMFLLSFDAAAIDAQSQPDRRSAATSIKIGNFVWDDLDGNGQQDAGEPGLAGVKVQLWNAAKTIKYDGVRTNASGSYKLIAPVPGDYRIRVKLPDARDVFTVKDAAGGDDSLDSDINSSGADAGFTDVISIASSGISIKDIDAGIIKFRTPTPIQIGNFVWDDLDGDGQQDAGEPGLAGVKIQLWDSTAKIKIAGTKTNASGIYTLIAPTPGDYRIKVKLPSTGDQFSPKDQAGGDDNADSDVNPNGGFVGFTDIFTLESNVISVTNYDVGIIRKIMPTPTHTPIPIQIGNFVWHDLNGDGRQDAGEPGIAGVKVQLWNAAMTVKIDKTKTNAQGLYTLSAPIPNEYRVRVKLPDKTVDRFTLKDAGDDSLDSDINPEGLYPGYTDIISIVSNQSSITTIDTGLILGASVNGNDASASGSGSSGLSIRDVTPTALPPD